MIVLSEENAADFRAAWADASVLLKDMVEVFKVERETLHQIAKRMALGAKAAKPRTTEYWTEEKVELLKALHAAGRSASQIAGALGDGVTRNACVGKAVRLGLGPIGGGKASAPTRLAKTPKPVKVTPAKVEPAAPAKGRQSMPKGVFVLPKLQGGSVTEKAVAARIANADARANPPENVVLMSRDFTPLPGSSPVPFGSKGCKWPVGGDGADMLQCGEPRDERRDACPYCAAHADVAFMKPKVGAPKNGNELMRSLRRWAA